MENNEIMDRLLQEDKPASDIKNDVLLAKQDWESSITKIRRVTAKYKLYIVILFIFIILFLIFWIPNTNDKLKSSKSAYDTANIEFSNFEISLEKIKLDGYVTNLRLLYEWVNSKKWLITRFEELDFLENISIKTYEKSEWELWYNFTLTANVINNGK